MKFRAAALLAACLWQSPAFAAASLAPPPSAVDDAQIDKLIDPFFTAIRSGQTRKAVTDYMATNAMMRAKTTELEYVVVQTDGVFAAYGRLGDCQLNEKTATGSWAETRLYICQHEKYLTRWIFTVIKLGGTWQAATFRYDDKITLDSSQ
ncbi:hypothetical protein KRR38_04840 [Novosphingobium sp. G106]|uniref:hypothetical protein n=1 Tax=Novosphingobium sp. G106 TaxID=2849500 RepID=UPI001C2CF367|nr:hypothetical protein [Novosphingobium sp. G106]MBV1687018.1 hypothetical protein [Novosphingobium sp. G106]